MNTVIPNEHSTKQISELVQMINSGKLFSLSILRNNAWTSEENCCFSDSILSGRPIPSLIFMRNSAIIAGAVGKLGCGQATTGADQDDSALYIIDGRQRLAAISDIFSDNGGNNVYYYDLAEIAQHYISKMDIRYDIRGSLKSTEKFHSNRRFTTASSIIDRQISYDNCRFYRCDQSLSGSNNHSVIEEFMERNLCRVSLGIEAFEKLMYIIANLFTSVRYFGVPCSITRQLYSVEEIRDAFSMLNPGDQRQKYTMM